MSAAPPPVEIALFEPPTLTVPPPVADIPGELPEPEMSRPPFVKAMVEFPLFMRFTPGVPDTELIFLFEPLNSMVVPPPLPDARMPLAAVFGLIAPESVTVPPVLFSMFAASEFVFATLPPYVNEPFPLLTLKASPDAPERTPDPRPNVPPIPVPTPESETLFVPLVEVTPERLPASVPFVKLRACPEPEMPTFPTLSVPKPLPFMPDPVVFPTSKPTSVFPLPRFTPFAFAAEVVIVGDAPPTDGLAPESAGHVRPVAESNVPLAPCPTRR